MKDIIIDRQIWQRGQGPRHPHPCAVDFLGGTFDKAAREKWWTTTEFHALVQSTGFDIVAWNDNPLILDSEREPKLVELCAKAGYAVTFIN